MTDKRLHRSNIIFIAVSVFVAVYLLFCFIFASRFMPGTTINGVKASFASPKSMESRISDQARGYAMSIETDGSVIDEIRGNDIALVANPESEEVSMFLKAQNPFLWPVSIFKKTEFVGDEIVTFDSGKLRDVVTALKCLDNTKTKKSQNATYTFDGEKYVIVDEVYGNQVSSQRMLNVTSKDIASLTPVLDLVKSDMYIKPAIKSDNSSLNHIVERLNKYLDAGIVYEEGFEIGRKEIAKWMTIGNNGQIDFDREQITEFVDDAAQKYNTYGLPKKFVTTYGDSIEVPGGNYGWKVDKEAEVEKIIEDLKSAQSVKREMEYQSRAANHGYKDYGNSYIEINLSKQHLFLYINGQCVMDTDFVSGNLSKGHGTHTGAYKIAYCQKNAVLRGEDYETPVNFWMPFNMGEGLHDATWRGSFGGNIFRTNGSHGCVNLPYNAAKTIFEKVEAGFPVLVYSMGGTENTYTNVLTPEAIMERINAIGEPTLDKFNTIAAIRNDFNKLPDDQKWQVGNIDYLGWAEAVVNDLAAQQAAGGM